MADAEETLHFMRVRSRDMEVFLDPEADIKNIVPTAFAAVVQSFNELGQKEYADKLDAIYNIFCMRLDEDSSSLITQINEFADAYDALPQPVRMFAEALFFRYMLNVFAMFQRRDGAADKADAVRIKNTAAMLMAHSDLSLVAAQLERLRAKTNNKYDDSVLSEDLMKLTRCSVSAVSAKQTVHRIKDIAYSLVGGTVYDDWSTLCTKCDRFFRESADTISDDTAVAVALAYPNYDTPTTGVDVTKGD